MKLIITGLIFSFTLPVNILGRHYRYQLVSFLKKNLWFFMLMNKTVVFFRVVERKVKHAKKRGSPQAAPDQDSEYKLHSMKKCEEMSIDICLGNYLCIWVLSLVLFYFDILFCFFACRNNIRKIISIMTEYFQTAMSYYSSIL